jgi:hypothetical protein
MAGRIPGMSGPLVLAGRSLETPALDGPIIALLTVTMYKCMSTGQQVYNLLYEIINGVSRIPCIEVEQQCRKNNSSAICRKSLDL